MKHHLPGNVRELENRLERAAIMSQNGVIDREVIASTGLESEIDIKLAPQPVRSMNLLDEILDERERVIAELEQSGWVQTKVACLLDMTPRQIAYQIQTLKIHVKQI